MKKGTPQKSLCHILNQSAESLSDGIGIFIARNAVLTAKHVIEANQHLTITNAKGEQTSAVANVITSQQSNLDAAVIYLDEAIGRSICPIATSPLSPTDSEVTLMTFFNKQQKQHPVRLCTSFDSAGFSSRFWANTAIQPGYSGSPIIDKRGRICAIATAIYKDNATNQPRHPFLATNSQPFLEFISKTMA